MASIPTATPRRLGLGEFMDPNGTAGKWLARRAFLDAVVKIEPRVRDELLPLHVLLEERDTHQLTKAIKVWQGKWNLTPDWCATVARETIARASALDTASPSNDSDKLALMIPASIVDEALDQGHSALLIGGKPFYGRGSEIYLELEDDYGCNILIWDPRREPRACAEERLSRTLKDALKAELDRIAAECRADGDLPVSLKREPQHFEWLARFQVKIESYAKIARDVSRGRQTVKDAIGRTAALIDIPLRKRDSPGRPRK